MLLDPLEEQFYLPARRVRMGDGERRRFEVAGQEDEEELVFAIEVEDSAQRGGMVLERAGGHQHNVVIALHAAGPIHGME